MAGNGGRSRGWPRNPSSESSSAVSSPQMYAPGAAVHDQVEVEPGAEDVLAEVALGVRLGDRVAQPAGGVHRLAADVDERPVGPDRVRGDDHALDQRVRVVRHQRQVLAGARLALVGVDHEVVRLAVALRDEAPLEAGREAGAATAAQAGVLDQLDQVVRVDLERPCAARRSRRAARRRPSCQASGDSQRLVRTGVSFWRTSRRGWVTSSFSSASLERCRPLSRPCRLVAGGLAVAGRVRWPRHRPPRPPGRPARAAGPPLGSSAPVASGAGVPASGFRVSAVRTSRVLDVAGGHVAGVVALPVAGLALGDLLGDRLGGGLDRAGGLLGRGGDLGLDRACSRRACPTAARATTADGLRSFSGTCGIGVFGSKPGDRDAVLLREA